MKKKLTGSTGNAVSDSLTRGAVATGLNAALAFAAIRTDLLTAEDVVSLQPAIVLLSFFLFGLFDKFLR